MTDLRLVYDATRLRFREEIALNPTISLDLSRNPSGKVGLYKGEIVVVSDDVYRSYKPLELAFMPFA